MPSRARNSKKSKPVSGRLVSYDCVPSRWISVTFDDDTSIVSISPAPFSIRPSNDSVPPASGIALEPPPRGNTEKTTMISTTKISR